VLTMRSAKMRNFSGHAAFPGGKADTLEETPCKLLLCCHPMSLRPYGIYLVRLCHS
jgi:hypothetical protein